MRSASEFGFRGIIWTLIGILTALPSLQLSAEALKPAARYQSYQEDIPYERVPSKEVSALLQDPFVDALQKTNELPPINVSFEKSDPLLDQDPFFLRAQSWKVSPSAENVNPQDVNLSFQESAQSISFILATDNAGQIAALNLKAPLGNPIDTPDYVLLFAKDDELFRGKSADQSSGFFVVSKSELLMNALTESRVGVYFFPLPQGAWHGKIDSHYVENLSQLIIANQEGEALPILLSDIEVMAAVGRNNLQMAMLRRVDHVSTAPAPSHLLPTSFENPDALVQFRKSLSAYQTQADVFPPRGSTAGFGLLFTGMDLEGSKASPIFQFTSLGTIWSKIQNFILPSVYAQEAPAPGLTPEEMEMIARSNEKLMQRVIRVGIVLGVAFTASVALRYTLLKKEFDKRREKIQSEAPAKKLGTKQHLKEIFDVYAHVLTIIVQVPPVLFANLLEYNLDRYFPKISSSENSWIRTFLNRTIFFSRAQIESLPVNWNTWLRGSVVLGGIDTALVGYQLYFVNAPLAHGMADVFPWLKSRAEDAFGGQNVTTDSLNRNELIRNLAGWSTNGAMSYSSDIRSQFHQIFSSKIKDDMMRAGLDMNEPENQAELERRTEIEIDVAMKKLGLPGKDEFLFDFFTIYNSYQKMMGYKLTDTERDELSKRMEKSSAYTGEVRPGLVMSSLKAARKEIAARYKEGGKIDKHLEAALDLYDQLLDDATDLGGMLKDPFAYLGEDSQAKQHRREVAEQYKKVRRQLISLTYEGDHGIDLRRLPTEWVAGFGNDGASIAAAFYRRAFLSLIRGEKILLEGLTDWQRRELKDAAEAAAKAEFLKTHPNATLFAGTEFNLLLEKHEISLYRKLEADRKEPRGIRDSWFKKRQMHKASIDADEAFLLDRKKTFDAATATAEEMEAWSKYYDRAILNIVGLYPDYAHNPELEKTVRESAKIIATSRLEDPTLKKQLEYLSPEDALMVKATIRAESEISAYIKATVNDIKIDPTDPAQPGPFQRLRQKESMRGTGAVARVGTRILRGLESFVPGTEYALGLKAKINRTVPFPFPGSFDLNMSVIRGFQRLPTMLTVTYLTNKFFWGADISWANWLLWGLCSFTISAPSQWLSRFFMYQNWKPMTNLKMTVVHAFIYSWATFWGTIPMYLFMGDFHAYFSNVFAPALGGLLLWKMIPLKVRTEWRQKLLDKIFPERESRRETTLREAAALGKEERMMQLTDVERRQAMSLSQKVGVGCRQILTSLRMIRH